GCYVILRSCSVFFTLLRCNWDDGMAGRQAGRQARVITHPYTFVNCESLLFTTSDLPLASVFDIGNLPKIIQTCVTHAYTFLHSLMSTKGRDKAKTRLT